MPFQILCCIFFAKIYKNIWIQVAETCIELWDGVLWQIEEKAVVAYKYKWSSTLRIYNCAPSNFLTFNWYQINITKSKKIFPIGACNLCTTADWAKMTVHPVVGISKLMIDGYNRELLSPPPPPTLSFGGNDSFYSVSKTWGISSSNKDLT